MGQVDPLNFPNKLQVEFEFSVPEMRQQNTASQAGNYHVMETDYEDYSIVMNCMQGKSFTIEFGWILSKNQQFRETTKYQDVLRTAVEKFGFKTEQAIEAEQKTVISILSIIMLEEIL